MPATYDDLVQDSDSDLDSDHEDEASKAPKLPPSNIPKRKKVCRHAAKSSRSIDGYMMYISNIKRLPLFGKPSWTLMGNPLTFWMPRCCHK